MAKKESYKYNIYYSGPNKRRSKRGQAMVKRRIKRKNGKSFEEKLESGEDYGSRNHTLKKLGFDTYKDYLKSNLWKKIRTKIMTRANHTCEICHSKATEVHHSRYHRNDLLGKTLKFLHVLCGDCHYNVEFKKGRKLSLKEAVEKQKGLTKKAGETRETESYILDQYGWLDEEFFSIPI